MEFKKRGKLLPHQRPLGKMIAPPRPKAGEEPSRKISVQQMCILLYHFYIGITDPEIYFVDNEESPEEFYKKINQEIEIDVDTLQKLLWYTTACFETGRYWNPADVDYRKFVSSLLNQTESYDQLLNIIVQKTKRPKGGLISG